MKTEETNGKSLSEGSNTNNDVSISAEKHEEDESNTVSNQDRTGAKVPTSQRKIDANRRNAAKSTGPRTARGRKTVAHNAVKFGFYSKFVLVSDETENRAEYDEFYPNLRNQYQPADFLEQLCAEQIAAWSWRCRRLLRAESARSVAGHRYALQQSRAMDLETPELAQSSSPEMDAMIDHLFLPPAEEIDKLLRYEAMISRQLSHATAELERLQARRKGKLCGAQ